MGSDKSGQEENPKNQARQEREKVGDAEMPLGRCGDQEDESANQQQRTGDPRQVGYHGCPRCGAAEMAAILEQCPAKP
jgi:DNA-directed RNA polymerase subunit M/transcription elongation factor TFIIS